MTARRAVRDETAPYVMSYYERADIPFQYALGFTWTTYAERLEAAGVSWQVYQEEANYSCNASEWFKPFQDAKAGDPLYEKTFPAGKFEYDFVASKIDAIAANPDLWNSTVFILSYDENDGLFDHVPPPTPPAGTADEFIDGLPIGGGFRGPVHHRLALERRRLCLQY